MTLAVAAICPWKPFVDRYEKLGLEIEYSVILAADSRWSAHRGASTKPLLDTGKKLYVVCDGVAGLFAGHVTAGHDSFMRMQRELKRTRKRDFKSVTEVAREAITAVYKREVSSRAPHEKVSVPLYVLIAMGNRSEGVRLVYLGYENSFRPEAMKGVQVLGPENARDAFLESLGSGISQWFAAGQIPREVTNWAIAVSASLDAAVNKVGGAVGGRVQLGIVHRNGYFPLKIAALEYVADPGGQDEWRTLTTEGPLHGRPRSQQN